MVQCKSTAEEVSFEWSHHRILSTNSKVRTTLQVSIIRDSCPATQKHQIRAIAKTGNYGSHYGMIITDLSGFQSSVESNFAMFYFSFLARCDWQTRATLSANHN